jgi:hypothetical protein
MLERLIGIKTLEKTEPVELEEVDPAMAPTMPPEFDHTVPLSQQFYEPEDLVLEEGEKDGDS